MQGDVGPEGKMGLIGLLACVGIYECNWWGHCPLVLSCRQCDAEEIGNGDDEIRSV